MPLKPVNERVELIQRHYRQLDLGRGWNRARFERLCRQLHCTPEELAALIGLKSFEMKAALKRDRFTVAGSIVMTLLDQALTLRQSGLAGPPVIPIHHLYPDTPSTHD